jgi:hypothetical protein
MRKSLQGSTDNANKDVEFSIVRFHTAVDQINIDQDVGPTLLALVVTIECGEEETNNDGERESEYTYVG